MTSNVEITDFEEIRAELEKVLNDTGFRRSERLSQFLRFVCETTLNGGGSSLNEYLIAHKVFGRGSEYSPNEDSVVRRQAHSLRQKLSDYYLGAGAGDRVRIELPTGRYVPAFVRQPIQQEAAPLTISRPVQGSSTNESLGRRLGVLAIGAALLVVAWYLGGVTQEQRRAGSLDPTLEELWKPWLSAPDGALICFSNPLTTVVKQFSFSLPADSNSNPPRIPVTPEQAKDFRSYFDLREGGHFFMYPARSQSKTGEALGSVTLTSMLARAGVRVKATQSRFLSWDTFLNQNLILLGHDEANRWLDPILDKLPLRMASTDGEKARRILDTVPQKSQPTEYYLAPSRGKDGISLDYALVSMIGGLDEHHQLLLINGLNTEGTQAAMEYLCNSQTAQNLVRRLREAAPHHQGDWRFQFILRTEVRDQVPTDVRLLLVKVL